MCSTNNFSLSISTLEVCSLLQSYYGVLQSNTKKKDHEFGGSCRCVVCNISISGESGSLTQAFYTIILEVVYWLPANFQVSLRAARKTHQHSLLKRHLSSFSFLFLVKGFSWKTLATTNATEVVFRASFNNTTSAALRTLSNVLSHGPATKSGSYA